MEVQTKGLITALATMSLSFVHCATIQAKRLTPDLLSSATTWKHT